MRVLLSNDDGIHSPGIQVLAKALVEAGHDVTVVAPERERSTTSHSLTLHKPLRIYHHGEKQFAVSGSPADCVYMATRFILKKRPDLVISGINRGANLGQDHFYSGTVAAAREAALTGIRSLAVSLVHSHSKTNPTLYWETAARFMATLAGHMDQFQVPPDRILNINVPNLPAEKIKGVRMSRQGKQVYSSEVLEAVDPRGRKYYWNGGNYSGFEPLPNSDCVEVDEGYIAVVPLRIDTTDYELKENLLGLEKISWRQD